MAGSIDLLQRRLPESKLWSDTIWINPYWPPELSRWSSASPTAPNWAISAAPDQGMAVRRNDMTFGPTRRIARDRTLNEVYMGSGGVRGVA
jgi:hypothetical protein